MGRCCHACALRVHAFLHACVSPLRDCVPAVVVCIRHGRPRPNLKNCSAPRANLKPHLRCVYGKTREQSTYAYMHAYIHNVHTRTYVNSHACMHLCTLVCLNSLSYYSSICALHVRTKVDFTRTIAHMHSNRIPTHRHFAPKHAHICDCSQRRLADAKELELESKRRAQSIQFSLDKTVNALDETRRRQRRWASLFDDWCTAWCTACGVSVALPVSQWQIRALPCFSLTAWLSSVLTVCTDRWD